MSSRWRRFEVLLPLQFNDGRDVPPERLADAVLEIVDRFGAASYETQKVEGHWRARARPESHPVLAKGFPPHDTMGQRPAGVKRCGR